MTEDKKKKKKGVCSSVTYTTGDPDINIKRMNQAFENPVQGGIPGMDNITNHEISLRNYALEKLKEVKDIIIYNETSESGIITFNIKDIFSQDLAIYLNKYNICVRAGNHCAKILKDELKIKNTCRISLYLYNTKEEIDKLVEVLNNKNLKQEII